MSCRAFSFCPELDRLLREGRAVGRSGKKFDNLSAISTENNLHVLRAVLNEVRPLRTLEVGLAFAGRAAVFASDYCEHSFPPDRQHTAIDPFQATVWDGCGAALLERSELSGYVTVVAEPSHAALPRLRDVGDRIDVPYIDGSHLIEDVFIDLVYTTYLLNVGGYLLFDDSQNSRVRKVLRFVDADLSRVYTPVLPSALGFVPLSGRSRWRRRLTNLLGRQQLTIYKKAVATAGSFGA